MPATDIDALNGRFENLKEDIRLVSDEVVKIHETVDQHTTTLADLGKGLLEVRAGQSTLGRRVDAFAIRMNGLEADSRRQANSLDLHTDILDRHTEMLTELLDRLPPRAS